MKMDQIATRIKIFKNIVVMVMVLDFLLDKCTYISYDFSTTIEYIIYFTSTTNCNH